MPVQNGLGQGFSNFFVSRPFPNIFKISLTLKCYKLQQILNKMAILVDFGDPKGTFDDPKKGCDPQFEKRWVRPSVLNLGYAYPQGYVKRPQVVREQPTGVRKIKKTHTYEAYLGRIFQLGVREGDTNLIWGYAEGNSFDLGVPKYQKFENPWVRPFLQMMFLQNVI